MQLLYTLAVFLSSALLSFGAVQSPILSGGTGTIDQLPLWKSTSTPYAAITTQTYGKNIYIPTSTATSSRLYATTFCINNGTPDCITAWPTSGAAASWPFTPATNFGVSVQSTTTPIFSTTGLHASSTSQFVSANIWSVLNLKATTSALLATDASGNVIATTTIGANLISGLTNGTVTSVAASVPTGWAITGSPITTSGTLAFAYDTGYAAVKTASTTNWNSFYDTPSGRITDGTGLTWSTNTLNCDTASGSVQGCLTSTDWTTFNSKEPAISAGTISDYWRGDKTWAATSTLRLTKSQITDFGTYLASTSLQTSALLSGLLGDETGSGSAVFSVSPTFTGKIVAAAASTTDMSASHSLYGPFVSALMLMDANNLATAYTGSSCSGGTVARSVNAIGAWTCTAVDISTDTNLTAGRSLTVSNDDVAADAELYTDSISFNYASSTIATSTTAVRAWKAPVALTVTQIDCGAVGPVAGTTTIQLEERTGRNTTGTAILGTPGLVCGTGVNTSSSTIPNASIAAESWIVMLINGYLQGSTNLLIDADVEFTKDD